MTDEDWLAAYMLQFGTATINTVTTTTQTGEAEFLIHMGHVLRAKGEPRNAWAVIRDTYERRMYDEETPNAQRP
jgi:hypothetical protein